MTFDISCLITLFLSIVGGSSKNSQSEANAGISGGRIDGKSQFLFYNVECLGVDEIMDDVLMLFNQIPCTMVVKYFLNS